MKNALILINSSFPYGTAISSRVLNFARLLHFIGYSVHVISEYRANQEDIPGQIYNFENITYQIIVGRKSKSLDSFVGYPDFIRETNHYLEKNPVDFVYMTSLTEMYTRIYHVLNKHKVKFFVDQCEWMNVSTYKFGYLDPRFLQVCFLRSRGFLKPSGIISISTLLDEYYKNKGIKSIRIPTILDVAHINCLLDKRNDNVMHISFIGSLGGKKELLQPVIQALRKNNYFHNRIVFDIYGPTLSQIEKNAEVTASELDNESFCVKVHGHIPQEKVFDCYRKSSFLIFIRPARKSSNAGFPTKLAESMSCGTPVITNNTGDVALYLKDGMNGFLLKDNTSESISECFNRILKLNEQDYSNLRFNARKTAENSFDYRNYSKVIMDFFEQ